MKANNIISIACLPVAGSKNPYQNLMIDGLNSSPKISALNGVDNRFLGVIKTVIKYKPNYLHFDWITSYYQRKKLWMTLLLLPIFYLQILYVKYFLKIKIVWTLHNITPHNAKYLWLHKSVRSFFANNCEWIRVFSKSSIIKATEELNVSKDSFIVVPEGDYTEVYPNEMGFEESRNRLQIDSNKMVLLYLGFIKPYKGLDKLIVEFSKIENNEIELIIAGENMNNDYVLQLKKMILDKKEIRIHLIADFIPVEKLQEFYNAADAVVLPFDKVENSGSAIMAMGFKKPILAPKMGVLVERLANQKMLLYDNLFIGLKTICNLEKKELKKIGKQNFEVLQKHKWDDFNKYFIK